MAIRVNFALSEQKTDQNISKKQNQNSLLYFSMVSDGTPLILIILVYVMNRHGRFISCI